MQYVRVEDWLRTYRELLAAEKAFTHTVELYCAGRVSDADFREAKQLLAAQRELADAVTARLEEHQRELRVLQRATDADEQPA